MILKDPPHNCSGGPVEDSDIFLWNATIIGPENSPYHNGIFKLKIFFLKNTRLNHLNYV